MSVMGYLEPAAAPVGRLRLRGGAGIAGRGAVLEGRMSVREAQLLDMARGAAGWQGTVVAARSGPDWNQAEVDAFWAGRDSVFR